MLPWTTYGGGKMSLFGRSRRSGDDGSSWDRVERRRMVESQLRPRGIRDERVLEAMERIPRHLFVQESQYREAYTDRALPSCEGQTISQPYMVALMTECLVLQGHEKVLEIGTGTGYQTAILCELCREVWSVEQNRRLADEAETRLREMGYGNVRIRCEDGSTGWPEGAPFGGVLVTAGAPSVPPPIIEQTEPGGRIVIPVGGRREQVLQVVTKGLRPQETRVKNVCGCVFVPLLGEYGWTGSNAH